jgi:hypothetical protein
MDAQIEVALVGGDFTGFAPSPQQLRRCIRAAVQYPGQDVNSALLIQAALHRGASPNRKASPSYMLMALQSNKPSTVYALAMAGALLPHTDCSADVCQAIARAALNTKHALLWGYPETGPARQYLRHHLTAHPVFHEQIHCNCDLPHLLILKRLGGDPLMRDPVQRKTPLDYARQLSLAAQWKQAIAWLERF